VSCVHAGTLDRAIELAADRARPGDVVLLAPACSSFDLEIDRPRPHRPEKDKRCLAACSTIGSFSA
jgi:hypothetical protein